MMHNVKIYAACRSVDTTLYDASQFDAVLDRVVARKRIKATMLSMASESHSSFASKAAWFAIQTPDNRELVVKKLLDDEKIVTAFPMVPGPRTYKRGRVSEGEKTPLLAGYLLIKIVPSPAAFVGLRQVKGVVDIVGGCEKPWRVSQEDVSRFIALTDLELRAAADFEFNLGDRVLFSFGPFKGIEGVIEKLHATRLHRNDSPAMLHADITACVHGQWHNLKRTPLALLEKL